MRCYAAIVPANKKKKAHLSLKSNFEMPVDRPLWIWLQLTVPRGFSGCTETEMVLSGSVQVEAIDHNISLKC
jgi:hypothetical protein